MTKYLTFCTYSPPTAYKHLALLVPRGTLSASELWVGETECLSDGHGKRSNHRKKAK